VNNAREKVLNASAGIKAAGFQADNVTKAAVLLYAQAKEKSGGDDGTRTRGLCRDSERLTSIFNNLENTDGIVSHWKYALGEAIVYHDVYHD
jgi:hypothetical protein